MLVNAVNNFLHWRLSAGRLFIEIWKTKMAINVFRAMLNNYIYLKYLHIKYNAVRFFNLKISKVVQLKKIKTLQDSKREVLLMKWFPSNHSIKVCSIV